MFVVTYLQLYKKVGTGELCPMEKNEHKYCSKRWVYELKEWLIPKKHLSRTQKNKATQLQKELADSLKLHRGKVTARSNNPFR